MTKQADDPIRDAHAAIVQAIADLKAANLPVPAALRLAVHALSNYAPDDPDKPNMPAQCSAVSRRLSPDMKLRWLPTVAGKVIVGGTIPFSGFDTRAEAVAAARKHVEQLSPPDKPSMPACYGQGRSGAI